MRRNSNFRGSIAASQIRNDRPQRKRESEKGMWSSMLDNVASGKKLPEKSLVVLGGTPETQKDFLDTLASDEPKRPQDRHKRKPVIANEFALGYTYQDVMDADEEDILARLSIYFLSESSPAFAPLLKPLFTPQAIPETLLVILLDWSEPWHWVRQLRDWIKMLRDITSSLDDAPTETMEQTMKEWQQRKRGSSTYDTGGSSTSNESNVTLPLSQGEWDEPLGLPLCVICHGADRIEALEAEHAWKEEEFDFVLQFLRTILMKHGASLIYTSCSSPNTLPTLIHSTLGIHSPLKRQTLKHNVIDRDKVLVPPNWDSWGKIRVLREGFDVEETSCGWTIDVQAPTAASGDTAISVAESDSLPKQQGAVLPTYESTIPNPHAHTSTNLKKPGIEISTLTTQAFLTTQLEILEKMKADEEAAAASSSKRDPNTSVFSNTINRPHDERVNEHIGPVQVNVGGIQVDADDLLKRLRSRKEVAGSGSGTPEVTTGKTTKSSDEMKAENDAIGSFFVGLVKRGASGSPRTTPGKTDASRDGGGTPSKKAAVKD